MAIAEHGQYKDGASGLETVVGASGSQYRGPTPSGRDLRLFEAPAFAEERVEEAPAQLRNGERTWLMRAREAAENFARRWIYAPLAKRLMRSGVRFLVSDFPDRVGHLASEIDLIVKEVELGQRQPRRFVLVAKRSETNRGLLSVWAQKITVISNPLLLRLVQPILQFPDVVERTTDALKVRDIASPYPRVLRDWGDRPPVIEPTNQMAIDLYPTLRRWGMRDGGWFVCLYMHEPSRRMEDERINRHRNESAGNFAEAIQEIVAQGGFVVRMGDPDARPMPHMEGVFDYAHSSDRSPELDIALTARCAFYLGSYSGVSCLATLFGRPCALTNVISCGLAPGLGPKDVSILKLVRDDCGMYFRFGELFHHGASRWRSADDYIDAQVHVEQNDPEDIRDLVIEMIERESGEFERSDSDQALHDAFISNISAQEYAYGSGASVARAFLRKYAALI